MDLWRLLHYLTSSWFRNLTSDIQRLHSTIVSLYLLLEPSLGLMTRRWNIIWRHIGLWAHISICKLILDIGNLTIFGGIWHYLSLWAKLLTNMQAILDYWSSVRFLITDHAIWLGAGFSIGVSTFPDILKLSRVTSDCVINGSVRLLIILTIPFVLWGSHVALLEALTNSLRLPFLS